jgi:hypothetical protein
MNHLKAWNQIDYSVCLEDGYCGFKGTSVGTVIDTILGKLQENHSIFVHP